MKCCGKNRTNYKDVLGGRFLPPPIPFEKTQRGIYPADVDNKMAKYGSLFHRLALKELEPVSDFQQLPFDFYCPSVRDHLADRICPECSFYIANLKSLRCHKKLHKGGRSLEVENLVDEEEQRHENARHNSNDDSAMPLTNIFDLLANIGKK